MRFDHRGTRLRFAFPWSGLFGSQAVYPPVADEPHNPDREQCPDESIEAMEVCAQDGPTLAQLQASVGKDPAPRKRAKKRVDVETEEIHARDTGRQGDEGADDG